MAVNVCALGPGRIRPGPLFPKNLIRGLASLGGHTLRLRSGQAASAAARLFLHNRAVAVADQPGAHGFGVFDVETGRPAREISLSSVRGRNERGIRFLFQSIDQASRHLLACSRRRLARNSPKWAEVVEGSGVRAGGACAEFEAIAGSGWAFRFSVRRRASAQGSRLSARPPCRNSWMGTLRRRPLCWFIDDGCGLNAALAWRLRAPTSGPTNIRARRTARKLPTSPKNSTSSLPVPSVISVSSDEAIDPLQLRRANSRTTQRTLKPSRPKRRSP